MKMILNNKTQISASAAELVALNSNYGADVHLGDQLARLGLSGIQEDFLFGKNFELSADADGALGDKLYGTTSTNATGAIEAGAAGVLGVYKLNTSATSGNSARIDQKDGLLWGYDENAELDAIIALNRADSSTTATNVFVGFAVAHNATLTSINDRAGLHLKCNASGDIEAWSSVEWSATTDGVAAAQTASYLGKIVSNNTFVHIRVILDRGSNKPILILNGQQLGSSLSMKVKAATSFQPYIRIDNSTDAKDSALRVDFLSVIQKRKKTSLKAKV